MYDIRHTTPDIHRNNIIVRFVSRELLGVAPNEPSVLET